MIGQVLGHYRILEKIGAGGMGVVYRAHDERLDRDVALKVLPVGTLADEAARRRFRTEALALSRLNHPNIETVHDFDTQAGVDFLVMEFIPGVTLNEKLATGPLPEKEVVRLGAQMAEGLAAAHGQSVVHRDLKPGNLRILPDGRLKILDFGLAKLVRSVEPEATASLTETHGVTGTVPYMAPEQLRGEPTDARTDIWAAGMVLYEMATGQRPYGDKHSTALADAILHTPCPPPGRVRAGVSSRLEEIILKCLEKEPGNRYPSAIDLLVDLRQLSAPAAARGPRTPTGRPRKGAVKPIRSLAVLPLENLSRDPEQEYFADGMTEALITDLAKIGALKVISRTSAMRYKGTDKPLPVIARELNVDGVVEGSVLRAGNRVRITAQLIHAATDEHLWAESYQRELSDILELQSEVARAIAQEVKVKLTPREKESLANVRRVNPEAHEAFLKGRYHWSKWTREGFEKGIEYFQQAAEIDSSYAPAYAGLAQGYVFLGYWSYAPYQETYPKAKAAALKALELDDSLLDAHCALGTVRWLCDWDLPACEGEYRRALELNPKDAAAHLWHAVFLAVVRDDFERALAEAERALELDPLSLFSGINAGWILYWARQYDRAIAQARKILDLDPNIPQAYYIVGCACAQVSRFEDAIAAFEKAMSLSFDVTSIGFLAVGHALMGRTDEVRALLKELEGKASEGSVPVFAIAVLQLALGDREQAIAGIERAYEERHPQLFWLRFFPGYDAVRDDPRIQGLLRRMNLPAGHS